MIRTLLATTAIATLLSTGAFAQSTTVPAGEPAPMTQDAAPGAAMEVDGFLATKIIGENVYNGTADDAQNIGNVNDLVISADGSIQSIIVGVGGFLGIGEKNVAVDFKTLSWAERAGDRWLVAANTTKEQLEAQPAFDPAPYDPKVVAAAPANTAADQNTTAAQNAAPAAPATDTTAQNAAPMAPAAPADATNAPDSTTTAAIDRSTLTELPAEKITADELMGTTVYGADDANVGEIGDVVLTADGKIDAYVIDVGGFLGVGEKPVAVGSDNLVFMTDKDGNKYLYTKFTKEQLEAQPNYDKETYATKRDEQRLVITQ